MRSRQSRLALDCLPAVSLRGRFFGGSSEVGSAGCDPARELRVSSRGHNPCMRGAQGPRRGASGLPPLVPVAAAGTQALRTDTCLPLSTPRGSRRVATVRPSPESSQLPSHGGTPVQAIQGAERGRPLQGGVNWLAGCLPVSRLLRRAGSPGGGGLGGGAGCSEGEQDAAAMHSPVLEPVLSARESFPLSSASSISWSTSFTSTSVMLSLLLHAAAADGCGCCDCGCGGCGCGFIGPSCTPKVMRCSAKCASGPTTFHSKLLGRKTTSAQSVVQTCRRTPRSSGTKRGRSPRRTRRSSSPASDASSTSSPGASA